MKRVNVFTYCTESSYGSVLQAYSLKRALSGLGFQSVILDTDKIPSESCPEPILKSKSPKGIAMYLSKRFVFSKSCQRYRKNMGFIKKHIDIEYKSNIQKGDFDERDIFLAGSDQVWNPVKLKPEFFLENTPDTAKKLTYAVSMGTLNIPEKNREEFGKMVKKFSFISVREGDCIPVLQKYSDGSFDCHIDPTFLTEVSHWRELEEEYSIDRPYILVYALYWDKAFNKELKKLHKATGKEIFVISAYPRGIYATKTLYDVGLGEFLWLVDHADGVVTSSFHGVAMSIIFNKKLSAVINPSSSSRISSLLQTLGYENQAISSLADEALADYSGVNKRIEEEREKGIEYLKGALEE